jgi:hypothetical protein
VYLKIVDGREGKRVKEESEREITVREKLKEKEKERVYRSKAERKETAPQMKNTWFALQVSCDTEII